MYFVDEIRNKFGMDDIEIFVDMDGVIAQYDVGSYEFSERRPLSSNIRVLGRLANFENVTMHILSICKTKKDIKDKEAWLDEYAPYFRKKNRHIIAKKNWEGMSSKDIKLVFLQDYLQDTKKPVILIDDDNDIIKHIKKNLPGITVYQDSSLVD